MMGTTHVLAGVASLWLLEIVLGAITPETLAPLAGLAALGALLPDLDAAESKIKHLSVGGVTPFAPVSQALHKSLGHRGLLHSLLGLAAVTAAALAIAWRFNLPEVGAVPLGYASHLAADACTRTGIPLLYPNQKRYHFLPRLLRLRTGSWAEEMLVPLLAAAILILLLRHLPVSPGTAY